MARFVDFGSIIFGQMDSSCQNKQLYRKFRVGYGSIRVSSSFESTFGEHISGVGSGMSSVRVSGLGSVSSVYLFYFLVHN